jgi:hypothetical protein
MGNTTTTRPMTTMGNTTTTRPITTMGNTTTTRPITTMGNTTTTRPMTTMGNTTTTRPITTMGNTTTTRPITTMGNTTTTRPITTMGNTTTTRPTTTMATTTTKAPTTTMATTTTKAPITEVFLGNTVFDTANSPELNSRCARDAPVTTRTAICKFIAPRDSTYIFTTCSSSTTSGIYENNNNDSENTEFDTFLTVEIKSSNTEDRIGECSSNDDIGGNSGHICSYSFSSYINLYLYENEEVEVRIGGYDSDRYGKAKLTIIDVNTYTTTPITTPITTNAITKYELSTPAEVHFYTQPDYQGRIGINMSHLNLTDEQRSFFDTNVVNNKNYNTIIIKNLDHSVETYYSINKDTIVKTFYYLYFYVIPNNNPLPTSRYYISFTNLNYKWINFGTPYGPYEYTDDITTTTHISNAEPGTTFIHLGKTYKYGITNTVNNLTYEIYFNTITIEPDIRLQYVAEI